jgi:ribosomal protein S18 acetylase RimI-like enzyme
VVAGFGACSEQRDSDLKERGFDGEIGAIYVLRCFQEQWIGRSLMKELTIDLSGRGSRGIALWVLNENARARRFHEKCGHFESFDRQKYEHIGCHSRREVPDRNRG